MQQISPHVYAISRLFINYYVIVYEQRLTIVDTGFGIRDVQRLHTGFEAQGWSLEQVHTILITHAHSDHIGGLSALQDKINAHTMVHRMDAPVVRGEQASSVANADELGILWRWLLPVLGTAHPPPPARVDSELQGGQILQDVYPGLEVIHLPGHSYGQVGFWLPDDAVLIGGDVMMHLPWGLTMPLRPVSPDWDAGRASIQKVIERDPPVLCLGHGPPVRGSVAARAQRAL